MNKLELEFPASISNREIFAAFNRQLSANAVLRSLDRNEEVASFELSCGNKDMFKAGMICQKIIFQNS